jgi:hypothetical protein
MAVEQVAEQTAEHIEEVAQVARQIDTRALKFFFSGISVGGVVGFILGYRFNRESIKAEAFKNSEEEIQKIRDLYQQKLVAAERKPDVEDLVKERGYSQDERVESEKESRPGYHSYRLKPPVPVEEPSTPEPEPEPEEVVLPPRIFRTQATSKDKMEGWNYPSEMSRRSSTRPYIIHQDEFAEQDPEYRHVTYIYYAEDDVLVDEDNMPIQIRENIVGPDALNRFGHGTDDYNILYVRNPRLELEMEICRDPGSYAEEVLGLDPSESNEENRS